MDWIARHIESDWIEINHYRRLGVYPDNRICYANGIAMNCNLVQQYAMYHNVQDLSLCSQVFQKLYPNLYPLWLNVLQSHVLYPYNMIRLPLKLYREYMGIMMNVLTNVQTILGVTDYNKMIDRVSSVKEYTETNGCRNTDIKYQARLLSFLSERITTFYIRLLMENNECFPIEIQRYDNAF